jgi:4-hydroxybenzoate polyprenyltransferase/flavin-dependent dehydrogenase
VKSWWRTLRVADWGIQLLLLWCAAFAYHAGSGIGAGAYVSHVARVSAISVLVLAGAYLFNNWCDRAQDRMKATCERRAQDSPRLVLALAVAAFAGGIALAVALYPRGWVPAVGAAQVAGAVAYSVRGVRLKERGAWGLLAAAMLQRIPGFLMVVVGFAPRWPAAAAILAWSFVVGLLFIVEHQVEDLSADRGAGVRTWATRAGRLRAQRLRHRLYGLHGVTNAVAAVTIVVGAATPQGVVSGLSLFALGLLLPALAWRRYVGNRSLPRRDEPARASDGQRVIIHGAGLSGLVAASRLADWGFAVEVRDIDLPRDVVRSAGTSVHAVRFDPAFVADYLDFPVDRCFERVDRETIYVEGRRRSTGSPHWVCRRGNGPGTLDGFLADQARKRGVTFAPAQGAPGTSGALTILATGLAPGSFAGLGLRHTPLHGWWAEARRTGPNILLTYVGSTTHPNYGYVASCGDTVYALLFSRRGVTPASLADFRRRLEATEGLVFEAWHPFTGAVPRECRLFSGDHILAGTLAGMMDPFWYSGVAGALLSGGVAALACVDPVLASLEHRRFTRTFRGQLLLADAAACLPWWSSVVTWAVNGAIDPAGSLGRWCRLPRCEGRGDRSQFPTVELQHEGRQPVHGTHE